MTDQAADGQRTGLAPALFLRSAGNQAPRTALLITMLFQSAESRYNQWVREHYRFLLRSAWALTGSRAIAEDVVQDCFANAWKHRGAANAVS